MITISTLPNTINFSISGHAVKCGLMVDEEDKAVFLWAGSSSGSVSGRLSESDLTILRNALDRAMANNEEQPSAPETLTPNHTPSKSLREAELTYPPSYPWTEPE